MSSRRLVTLTALATAHVTLLACALEASDGREPRPGRYVGMASCANGFCHGATAPRDSTSVLQNEYPTWMLGPHRGAYRTLTSDQSREIARSLDPGGKPAHERPDCLSCHLLSTPSGQSVPALGETVFREDGISCEGCHGPAGGWRDRHFEADWTHQQSLSAGMTDLRDPARRAAVCLRCHLGAAGAAVDHRLIAAGHPRLYFELDNYTGQMPRHWKLDRPHSVTGARAWAAGQVAAYRAALALLAGHARREGSWPELAELNCEGCHHSLASGAWRRLPGYRYRDGRPRFAARHVVLSQLVAELAGSESERFETAVEQLARSVATLGRPGDVADRADALIRVLDDVGPRIEGARWEVEQVRSLIRRLAAARSRALTDLVAAEQTAFALQSLLGRWTELDRRRANSRLARAIDDVFRVLDDPVTFDRRRLDELLAEIEELVSRSP